MVDVNTQCVNDAFNRLSEAALNGADASRKCQVNADDLSAVLMAFTLAKNKAQPTENLTKNISLDQFIKIDSYEDCPCDQNLVVWTGDTFETEFVTMCGDHGTYYPANDIEFSHYALLPSDDAFMDYAGE